MDKKPSSFSSFFFKRLKRKDSSAGAGHTRRWKSKSSTGSRWKRKFNLRIWLLDTFLFKIVSIFEAVVLVSKLCFFYLCCGCHFWWLRIDRISQPIGIDCSYNVVWMGIIDSDCRFIPPFADRRDSAKIVWYYSCTFCCKSTQFAM